MTELGSILLELGLTQYLDAFIEQGFDTWETILDITESDFDALGVKLGHRRKLQRRIASSRGHTAELGLVSPTKRQTPSDDRQVDESLGSSLITSSEIKDAGPPTGKRKYKRHPKPDEDAPERPPSAYVIFSNKMREDLKGRNLSFTEIAKLVGENWQTLSAAEKEPYEAQAFAAKEKYNGELAKYKKTEKYKMYAEYLAGFKAKQASVQQAAVVAKRPKLENQGSNGSSGTGGTGSSTVSQYGGDLPTSRISAETPGAPRYPPNSESYSQSQLPPLYKNPHSHGSQTRPPSQGSPQSMSNALLPGYRDIVIGSTSQQHTLAWREGLNGTDTPHLRPMTNAGSERRSSGTGRSASPFDSPSHPGMPTPSSFHSKGPRFTPPLLTSESTNSTTSSQASVFYPRTPLDTPFDRALPVPSFFSAKPPPPSYDTQLPPLRSLSPQSSQPVSRSGPPGAVAADYLSTNPRRTYYPPPPHTTTHPNTEHHPHTAHTNSDTEQLDPVSALLRASDIVSRNLQSR
ncbi:MAG: hypothetical protein M1818_001025 [Claussenomyces sp. TS43310]|nr:MAG: hypothetical protein M1818_001025 [Claussenomyces sp. TS43310]